MTATKKNMRAVVSLLLSVLLMLTLAAFPAEVSALSLSTTNLTVTKGYASTIKLEGATSAKWSSSDKTVATVSSAGKVTGKSVGTAVITANVGGTKLTCNVTVVGGKLALSKKSVTLEKGGSEYITVRAKGDHGLKVASGDKGIVTASWVKPWKNDDIRLKLTAKSAGTTTVKISLSKYPDIYTMINVTVKGSEALLETSQSSVSTTAGGTANFVIYSNANNSVSYGLSDSTVAKVTEGAWKDGYCTVTVTGLKEGSTLLTIRRKDNSSVSKAVSITVSGGGYYTVLTAPPSKLISSDIIYKWTDSTTGGLRYVLVPYTHDIAKVNSIIASDSRKYEYYTVYETAPAKMADGDTIKNFTATVSSQSVTRYVLVPKNADIPSYNTAVASYTGVMEYWTIYNKSPENKKLMSTDVVKSWTATVNGKAVTRYVLLPLNYSEQRLNELIASDAGTVLGGYYTVSTTTPALKASTDKVIPFTTNIGGINSTAYVLAPANYDEARVNDAIAAYNGVYDYWKVYTVRPTTRLTYDVIESWTKLVDSKQVARYMLLPVGYDTDLFAQYKTKDLGTSSSVYYTVTTSYPVKISTSDVVYLWYNPSQNSTKYVLLPERYDIIKRNELQYKDTGVFEYYYIYSTPPIAKETTDIVLNPQYKGNTVYMLVPKDFDQAKVNQGLAGLAVT